MDSTVTTSIVINNWQTFLLSKLSSTEILYMFIALLLGYMLYLALSNPSLYEERYNIKSKYKKRLRKYIKDSIATIHNKSVEGARNVIKSVNLSKCDLCGNDPVDVQLNSYDTRLELVLRDTLIDGIFDAIFENGYHDLSPIELENYFNSTGGLLYDNVVEVMFLYERHFPDIINHATERFSKDYAIKIFKDIILFYLDCQQKEGKELTELSYRYNKLKQLYHFITRKKRGK